jgi:predicted O-linked N-acetylglucosamine transferase (SPINDLY family)
MIAVDTKKPLVSEFKTHSVPFLEPSFQQRDDDRYQTAQAKHRAGDLIGAEFLYRQILSENPTHAGAWHFLGMIFHKQSRSEESLQYIEKSIRLENSKSIFYNNYGVVLIDLGKREDALLSFQKALELDQQYEDARVNLDQLRSNQKEIKNTKTTFEYSSLPVSPTNHLEDLFRQGNQLSVQERFHDANRVFHQAASLPGGRELWRWKSLNFCPSIFPDEDSIERYWGHLNEGLDQILVQNIPIRWEKLPYDGFTPSFNLPHLGRCCREVKEKFSKIFETAFSFDRPTLKKTMRNHNRIRVGFVTTAGHHRGFLRVHRHLLEHLDSKRFEIFLFCPDSILEFCRQTIHHNDIHYVGFPDKFDVAVRTIFETQCDILYHWKVGGGTFDYFLAMAKTAPIQCTSLGSHGTSGVGTIDYYISTSILEFYQSANQYTEQHILFDSYPTSHPYEPVTSSVSRYDLGLPQSGAIYFCPHRLPKYHPCIDQYFRLILEGDPTGHLLLCAGKKKPLADLFAKRLYRSLGSELFHRIRIIPALPLDMYRKYLTVVTCVLDSPIYVGDLTTHDAFCQGIPVVTQEGELLVQRYTAGLYRTMGLDSLVSTNAEDYARIAVRLGTDSDYRQDIHHKILERNQSIFMPTDTVHDYERFFEYVCSTDC